MLEYVYTQNESAVSKYMFYDIEQQHLKQLKIMVLSMFPVSYDNAFYKNVLTWPVKKIAFYGSNPMGALCARTEIIDGVEKMYIAILGVMVFWRRRGIGKMLLDFVEEYCKENASISSIYLHVQKNNKDAQEFYSRSGFVVTQEIPNFYRRTACPTAIIMEKFCLRPGIL